MSALEVVPSVAASLSAAAAMVTAVVAVRSLRAAKADSRSQSRPVVVAFLRRGPELVEQRAYLLLQNFGASVARDLEVSFSPELPDRELLSDGRPSMVPSIRARYSKPVAVLAPGQLMMNICSHEPLADAEDWIPDPLDVTVRYQDDQGRTYSDTFKLEISQLGHESWAHPAGDKYEKRIAKGVEAIAWEQWRS